VDDATYHSSGRGQARQRRMVAPPDTAGQSAGIVPGSIAALAVLLPAK